MNPKLLFSFFILFACFGGLTSQEPYRLSICAIFQNEAPYLREWVEYHHYQGVEHFWLYNNDSKDGWQEVLAPYISSGLVEVKDWPNLWPEKVFSEKEGCQPKAYNDCLTLNGTKTQWLAFIDIDEFIVPMQKNFNLPNTLETFFSHVDAIFVTWRLFGTSGVTLFPGQSQLFHLTKCAERKYYWNRVEKSIVRPESVVKCVDAHFCYLKNNKKLVDGDGNKVTRYRGHSDFYLRINHYTFHDESFLEEKRLRYAIRGKSFDEILHENLIYSQTEDHKIIELLPPDWEQRLLR